jgi:NACalpha-BTF3-like transcription factor
MAKHLYLKFENDRVIALSLNMSEEHLAVYSDRFNIDMNFIKKMKEVEKAKLVYINLDSEYVIAYKDKNNNIVYYPAYIQFIRQNNKEMFINSIKPLSTPKIPKTNSNNNKNLTTEKKVVIDNKNEEDIDIDLLIQQKELIESKISKVLKIMESDLINCVENEDFEKAAQLRDKINKLK